MSNQVRLALGWHVLFSIRETWLYTLRVHTNFYTGHYTIRIEWKDTFSEDITRHIGLSPHLGVNISHTDVEPFIAINRTVINLSMECRNKSEPDSLQC